MVVNWVLKELRNLLRLHAAGIPCPLPIDVSSHVLLMSFAGVYTPHCMPPTTGETEEANSGPSLSSSHGDSGNSSPSSSSSLCSSPSTCCSPSCQNEVSSTKRQSVEPTEGFESLSVHNKRGFFRGGKETKESTKDGASWTYAAAPRLKDLPSASGRLCCLPKAYALYRAWARLYVQVRRRKKEHPRSQLFCI